MADPILLREVENGGLQWLDLQMADAIVASGSFAELAGRINDRQMLLVWPAADALLIEVELPVRKASQIAKALPFALEDHLAEDVESYHLVWQRIPGSERVAVLAVAHAALASCRQRFAAAGLPLQMILPEPLLLPWANGNCSVLLTKNWAVFRDGTWTGGGGEPSLVKLMLKKLHARRTNDAKLQIYASPNASWQGDEWACLPAPADRIEPLTLYAGQWQASAALNLLGGPYAAKGEARHSLRQVRPAAAIFLLALLLQFAGQWLAGGQREHQLTALEAQNQALFRQTFPDIKRLVNLKVQADQQLLALQKQAQVRSGFLDLLYRVGNRLKDDTRLSLRQLQFADDALQLHVQASDPKGLDILISQLQDKDRLQAESRNVTSVKNGVEAEVVVRQN